MTDTEKDKRWEDFLKIRDDYFARNPHLKSKIPNIPKYTRREDDESIQGKSDMVDKIVDNIQSFIEYRTAKRQTKYNENLTDDEKVEISNRVIGQMQALLDKHAAENNK